LNNPFSLFDLPVRFELDLNQLEQIWRLVQRQFHPDRLASRPQLEQRLAAERFATLGEAYRTLKDPINRAQAVCGVSGHPMNLESSHINDSAFLVQQMQWREELEEAQSNHDIDAHARLAKLVENEKTALHQSLTEALDHAHDYVKAALLVKRLQFVLRFNESLHNFSS